MADNDIHNAPGYESAEKNFSAVTKTVQSFATEMQRASKETMESASHLMEQLRGAKTVEEIVSIQTNFMQHSFSQYTDFTRRVSELMVSVPMEMAKNSKSALQQGTDAMKRAGEQMGEHMQKAGDQFTHKG